MKHSLRKLFNTLIGASTMTTQTITIHHREVAGRHVLTSDEVEGFYLAEADFDSAIKQIPEALEILYAKNEGQRVRARPLTGIDTRRFEHGLENYRYSLELDHN